jgi:hypothetical protein
MISSVAQRNDVPDLEDLCLNEIESNGAGSIRLRFDGQITAHHYHEISIFLTDASIICADFECDGFFPLTSKININQINEELWRVEVYFEIGSLTIESKRLTSHLLVRERGVPC